MLGEKIKIIRGTIKEFMKEGKEKKNLEERQEQYIKNIVEGCFSNLIVREDKIAEIIVKWCDKEKNPVEFFLKQLLVLGIEAPVELANIVEAKERYSFVLKENNNDKLWILHLSKIPKEYMIKEVKIDEKTFYSLKKIPYKVLGEDIYEIIFQINKENIDFRYCKGNQIKISIGKRAEIIIDRIGWSSYDLLELYPKAMNLINEIILLDTNLNPYNYYMAIKQIIQKYYDLKGAQLIFKMPLFTISSIDGKLVDFEDTNKGITIRNYNDWYQKEYNNNKGKVVFEKDRIKIIGARNKQVQELIDIAEKAIKEVESLEY